MSSNCSTPPTAPNVCGRLPRSALYKFDASDQTSAYGDPNYGYISPCRSATCNSLTIPGSSNTSTTSSVNIPNLDPTKWGPAPCIQATCYNTLSAACIVSEATCSFANLGGGLYCQSNWDDPLYATNMVNCCAGLLSSSADCIPEACPANVSTGDNTKPGTCQDTMLAFCTPTNWIANANACDNYVKLSPQAVSMGSSSYGNINPAQQIIQNAVQQYYLDPNNPHTPMSTDGFAAKAVELCRQYPGTCDSILQTVCAPYTKEDLDPTQFPITLPDGTTTYNYTPLQTCGCFLNTDQYYLENGNTVPCNTVCGAPGTIPLGTASGTGETCGGTACILDGITINLLNSSVGDIKLSQMCNNCTSCTGPCRCYIRDVTVNSVNSTYAGSEIFSSCGSCFLLDNDDPPNATPIACSELSITANTSGSGGQEEPSFWDKTTSWLAEHKYIAGGLLVVIALLLVMAIVYFVFAQKKPSSTNS